MSDSKKDPEGVSPSADAVRAPGDRGAGARLRPEHLYKAAGLLLLLALFYRYFQEIASVLLLIYAAALLAVLFNLVVRPFPVDRKWIAGALGLLIVGLIGVLLWIGIPALLSEVRSLADRAEEFEAQLLSWESWLQENTGLQVSLVGPQAEQFFRSIFEEEAGGGALVGRAQGLLEILFVPLIIFFGALFAVGKPNDRLLSPTMRMVPRDLRPAFERIFSLLGVRIVGWLRGTLVAMVGVGLLSYALYTMIGVPNALLLAVLSGLLEFVPLFGPWVAGVTATMVAFVADPTKALWTAVAALAIQQIESNLITPFAMSRAADVHPFVTLFALVLFGGIFGFLGIFLAIPLVLLFWTVVQVLWVERTIDTDEDRIRPVVEE